MLFIPPPAPQENLEECSWFGFYCSMNWKRSCYLWRLRAVTYHCRRELFSQTSLLFMIYITPFYLNPGVASSSMPATKNHLSVVYNHTCESLDHSYSLQYHFSVINRYSSKFFHCILQNLWLLQKLLRVETVYFCITERVKDMSY